MKKMSGYVSIEHRTGNNKIALSAGCGFCLETGFIDQGTCIYTNYSMKLDKAHKKYKQLNTCWHIELSNNDYVTTSQITGTAKQDKITLYIYFNHSGICCVSLSLKLINNYIKTYNLPYTMTDDVGIIICCNRYIDKTRAGYIYNIELG